MNLNDRERILKRARQRRRADRAPRQRPPRVDDLDAWNDDDPPPPLQKMKTHSSSLDDYVGEILAEEEHVSTAGLDAPERPAGPVGQVVHLEAGRGEVWLRGEDRLLPADLAADLLESQTAQIAVGDEVILSGVDGDGPARIEFVLSRRTQLSRPKAAGHGEQVIVANVDAVVIVAAAKEPPFRPRLVDRYLIAIQRGGAQPILCLNKVDLISDSEEHAALDSVTQPYRDLGVPVVYCSAIENSGVEELRKHLTGISAVLVGHSGVGKSSLTNQLGDRLELDTGHVTSFAGKGRHTTTSSTLYRLGGGTAVIDTPGIRSFGLWDIAASELADYFPEFDAPREKCRFNDCQHRHEPQCGVRQAVDDGQVSPARYDAYRRIYEDVTSS